MIPLNQMTPGAVGKAGAPPPITGATKNAALLADSFGAAQFQQFLDQALQWKQPQPVQTPDPKPDKPQEAKANDGPGKSDQPRTDNKQKDQSDEVQATQQTLTPQDLLPTPQAQAVVNPLVAPEQQAQVVTDPGKPVVDPQANAQAITDPSLRNQAWQVNVFAAKWQVTTRQDPQQQMMNQPPPMTTGVMQNNVQELASALMMQQGPTNPAMGPQQLQPQAEPGERVEVKLNELVAQVSGQGTLSDMEGGFARIDDMLKQLLQGNGVAPVSPASPVAVMQAAVVEQWMQSQNGSTDNGLSTQGANGMLGVGGSSATGATKAAGGPVATLSTQSPRFADELAEQVGKLKVYTRPGQSDQVRITLDPQDMGEINMRLKVDKENKVHLMITTETEATKEMLTKQIGQLKEALARGNLGFGEVTVHVGTEGRREPQGGGNNQPWESHQGGRHEGRGGGISARGGGEEAVPPASAAPPTSQVDADGVSVVA